ncbi:MAG: glycosyltransferase family 39 protein [Actinomycetota bacterium]|nr:glycosyltransferase family 39 protein [Actinomycetota bacterium]
MERFERRPRLTLLTLVALTAVGAGNFLWQLGSSSLYVDEVQSVEVSIQPLAHFLHLLAITEITPPGYFLLLHEWVLRLGSPHLDWVYRLPSATAGILLVPAIYWLALRTLGRRAPALFAAGLGAISPFLLDYSQRAQGYVFVALGATVAVAAALQAENGNARNRWLAVSLSASLLALLIHYLAVLAVVPVCLWVATRRCLRLRWRVVYPASCLLLGMALVPLLVDQHASFPQRTGAIAGGSVSGSTLLSMAQVPFDGRVEPLRLLGILVVAAAFATLLLAARRGRAQPNRTLALPVGIAAGGPLVLTALSLTGGHAFWGHLMLARYAAAAAPFVLLSLVAAVQSLPRPVAALLGTATALVSIAGILDSHRRSGFFLDARGVVSYVAAARGPGDAVLAPASPGAAVPLLHYGLGRLQPLWEGEPAAQALISAHRVRMWVISQLGVGSTTSSGPVLRAESAILRSVGYRSVSARVFPSTSPTAVILAAPASPALTSAPIRTGAPPGVREARAPR